MHVQKWTSPDEAMDGMLMGPVISTMAACKLEEAFKECSDHADNALDFNIHISRPRPYMRKMVYYNCVKGNAAIQLHFKKRIDTVVLVSNVCVCPVHTSAINRQLCLVHVSVVHLLKFILL